MKKEIFDKKPFYSNQQSVSHTFDKFIIDFKNITPQIELEGIMNTIVNHKAVILDVYIMKELFSIMNDNIKTYENTFGKIDDKKIKEKLNKFKEKTKDKENYIG